MRQMQKAILSSSLNMARMFNVYHNRAYELFSDQSNVDPRFQI